MSSNKLYTYRATVTHVVDGDTVDVTIDLGFTIFIKERVRLSGIDAPESRTSNLDEKKYGLQAKQWLVDELGLVAGEVVIETTYNAKGKFGRVLAALYVTDERNLNEEMIRLGLATRYTGGHKAEWSVRKAALLLRR